MIQSMTGFGKATCTYQTKKITVEVKSLNSKQFDISTHISNLYKEKDLEIRKYLGAELKRGKIDFTLFLEENGTKSCVRVNDAVVADYYNQLQALSQKFNTPLPQNWIEIALRLPDALQTESVELEPEEWDAVNQVIHQALEHLIAFRTQEGLSLYTMFVKTCNHILELLKEVEKHETNRLDKIKSRLEDNLNKLEDRTLIDKGRLEQEMIYYIEKLDINEEKLRLRNHVKYFLETLEENVSGKKLNFISQEMGREINTLGSKSNNSEMQVLVVQMKDDLEQIKEQVLNVL